MTEEEFGFGDDESLRLIRTYKERMFNAESSGQIKGMVAEIQALLRGVNSYEANQKIVFEIFSTIFSDPNFFNLKGVQKLLDLATCVGFEADQKKYLLDLLRVHYPSYELLPFCENVCWFVYYDLFEKNTKEATIFYKELLQNAVTQTSKVTLKDALYLHCGISKPKL